MSPETYINHPNFGLLFRICLVEENKDLFATLYAQRLFFLVSTDMGAGLAFAPIGRSEARMLLEGRLRILRRAGQYSEYDRLQKTYQQTFQ
ncbi:MAG: PipX family protein [Cyanobacteria bacterium P01_G01_bin.38]